MDCFGVDVHITVEFAHWILQPEEVSSFDFPNFFGLKMDFGVLLVFTTPQIFTLTIKGSFSH